MTQIPLKIKKKILADKFYTRCAREGFHGHECAGRITWEHAIIYAGKQVQEVWAIIPLCEKAHAVDHYQDGGDMNKEINEWVAFNRATDLELKGASKAINYMHRRYFLNQKYGVYTRKVVDNPVDKVGINCEETVEINYGLLQQQDLFTSNPQLIHRGFM